MPRYVYLGNKISLRQKYLKKDVYHSWREYGKLLKKHAIQNPSKYVMWYPGFTFRTNKFLHAILSTALHVMPAFVLDLLIRIQGGKPM